jgi:hypothetical protein
LLTVAQNTMRGFDSQRRRLLNVRPLWPIAQVILMSHLFAGGAVVWEADPEQLATQMLQGARGYRWSQPSSCAGSTIWIK